MASQLSLHVGSPSPALLVVNTSLSQGLPDF